MEDDDRLTPVRTSIEIGRWTPTAAQAIVTAFVLIVALIMVPGYFVGGWFQSHNIARTYHNVVISQAYQDGLLSQMQQHLSNISGAGGLAATRAGVPANSPEQVNLRAQELNEVSQLCSLSVRFVPQSEGPAGQQLQQVITANCLAGAPIAQPPLANPVPEGQ